MHGGSLVSNAPRGASIEARKKKLMEGAAETLDDLMHKVHTKNTYQEPAEAPQEVRGDATEEQGQEEQSVQPEDSIIEFPEFPNF